MYTIRHVCTVVDKHFVLKEVRKADYEDNISICVAVRQPLFWSRKFVVTFLRNYLPLWRAILLQTCSSHFYQCFYIISEFLFNLFMNLQNLLEYLKNKIN